jgi:hypothetical protein
LTDKGKKSKTVFPFCFLFCERLRLSGDLSTFFFEKKVAKKQKSLQDLSALSVLL